MNSVWRWIHKSWKEFLNQTQVLLHTRYLVLGTVVLTAWCLVHLSFVVDGHRGWLSSMDRHDHELLNGISNYLSVVEQSTQAAQEEIEPENDDDIQLEEPRIVYQSEDMMDDHDNLMRRMHGFQHRMMR